MPADILMKFSDPQVASAVLEKLMAATSDGSFGCDMSPRVLVKLMGTALGDQVFRWTASDLNRYGSILPYLSPRILGRLDGRALSDTLPQMSQISSWSDGQAYAIVGNLASSNASELYNNVSGLQLGPLMDKMNSLGPYVLPEFLLKDLNSSSSNARSAILTSWATKLESLAQRGNINVPLRSAQALVQYRFGDVRTPDTFSQQNLAQILQNNPSYLVASPWRLWKMVLRSESNFNKGQLQRLAFDKSASSGLSGGQVRRLSAMAVRLFRNGDHWDMSNCPSLYWVGANQSELIAVPTSEMQAVADRIGGVAGMLTNGQLQVIYTKVTD